MAEQKPSEYQSKFKVLEPSSLSAGLKSSILSSASSPAISAMTKQSDDFNKSRDKSQNKGTTNFFLTVPESPLKLQNSSSSSSISSWFRTPFGSSFHLTTDIEQQAENISDASYLGNEIQLGIDMIKLSHNNLDSDNIKSKYTKVFKLENKLCNLMPLSLSFTN